MVYVIETEELENGSVKVTVFVPEAVKCEECLEYMEDKKFGFLCRSQRKFFHDLCIRKGHFKTHEAKQTMDETKDLRVLIVVDEAQASG